MKIMLVNKYHYLRGGDCTHTFALAELLQEKGHEIRHFSMHHPNNFKYEHDRDFVSYIDFPDEMKKSGIKSKLKVLSRMLYSKEARKNIKDAISDFRPDLIHFHNIHKHLTTSILLEANKQKIPVIWTLHDYNLICPNISFICKDKVCERCKSLRYLGPMSQRCSNNSIGASMLISIEKFIHDMQGVRKRVTYFVSPSSFLKKKFVEYGFDKNTIKVIPNFFDIPKKMTQPKRFKKKYFFYLGRVSREKGIETLCRAAESAKVSLIIAGTGPVKEELEKKYSSKSINFVGYKTGRELVNLRKKAWFVAVPSEWYENNPFSIIESFSDSVPVIGANIGGIPELVKHNISGYIFGSKNEEQLVTVLKKANSLSVSGRNKLGKNARAIIEKNNNPEKYYQDLIKVYKRAIKEGKKWKR